MLSVSIETTRTNDVPAEAGALNTALDQVRFALAFNSWERLVCAFIPGTCRSAGPQHRRRCYRSREPQMVRENGIFAPFIYKNEHFAKTGSGQT